MSTCVICSNCQGGGIAKFLKQHKGFSREYDDIIVLRLFEYINSKRPLPVKAIEKVDLFIYQPVSTLHGKYSTPYLKSKLSPECTCISFPYLFNSGMMSLSFGRGDKMFGSECILPLVEEGHGLIDIVKKFVDGKIDFKWDERFEYCMSELEQREAATDVKASQFIRDNFRQHKLFLSHNHPTSLLLVYCANQILDILGLYPLREEGWPENLAGLHAASRYTPYDIRHFGYQFYPNPDWVSHNVVLIESLVRDRFVEWQPGGKALSLH